MIKYPTDNRLESKFECALSHPTFFEGMSWLITVEHERACDARIEKGSYETCFDFLIREFIKRWHLAGKPIDLLNEVKTMLPK